MSFESSTAANRGETTLFEAALFLQTDHSSRHHMNANASELGRLASNLISTRTIVTPWIPTSEAIEGGILVW